jgi:hypothetical protein
MSTGFPAAPEETAEGTLDVLKLLGGMQKFEDKVFEEVATSTKFLPRLQLFSSNSSEVKEDKIRMGHYGLVTMKGQPVIDLTSTVDVLVCVWRPKALDMSDINNVVSIFDVTNPMFVSIASKADDTDSGHAQDPPHQEGQALLARSPRVRVLRAVRDAGCRRAAGARQRVQQSACDRRGGGPDRGR